MNSKFTQFHCGNLFKKMVALAILFCLIGSNGYSQKTSRSVKDGFKNQKIEIKKQTAKAGINPAIISDNDAGLPSRSPVSNSINAICQTFTGSLGTGDNTMPQRLTRPGANAGTCGTTYTFPGGFGTGPYYYDTHTYTNTTGLSQCGTFTLTSTDATNANIAFGVWNNSFNPLSLGTNFLADLGTSTGTPANPITFSVDIPSGATIVIPVWSANVNTAPSGTAADYTVTVSFPICSSAPCSGTPAPGNTIASSSAVCPLTAFSLSLQNATPGSGVTYQWQSSATGTTGSFTNITGATNPTLTVAAITATTYYQAIVTCSGASTTSSPAQVNLNPPSACYCIPPASNCSLDDDIQNVTLLNLNNSSGCAASGYTNYAGAAGVNVPDLVAGGSIPISVTVGPGGGDYVAVWIDANRNGSFEASEYSLVGNTSGGVINGTVLVPASALTGITRMRVRNQFGSAVTPIGACASIFFGETEDYSVNIQPCVPITFTTQPVDKSTVCGSTTFFKVKVAGSFPAYEWQYRTSASGVWMVVPNAAPYSGVNTDSLTVLFAPATLNGYQYRVSVTGACAATNPSNPATLTVTPFLPTVSPASATVCAGTITKLTLTDVAAPSIGISSTSSGNINLAIPDDGTSVGISNTISVPALPAGATITGWNVNLNINHSYIGDLVIVLKSPNGKIVNLDYGLTQTGGAGPTTGFTNTIISSAGTATLVSGTDPWTGTFKPDNQDPGTAGTAPLGPDGFIPNTRNLNDLFQGAGNWTLASYDLGAPDAGTIVNWTMNITYVLGLPVTGTWGPTALASTIYTDAAATVPYVQGTQANTVYVKPTAGGVNAYSVTASNGTCTGSRTVNITVNAPATAVAAVANQSTCPGGTVKFTSSVTGGAGVVKIWQVSTDGGATYTNLANNTVYSGVATDELTVKGATATFNGYKYRLSVSAPPCTGTALTSAAGTLTVFPAPQVVLAAAPYSSLYPGLTTTLTVAVSPTTAASYMWYKNGVLIPGVTGNMYPGLGVDDFGTYNVKITDANGCAGTSNSIILKDSASGSFFVYPSPNNGQFSVRYYNENPNAARALSVYDSKGSRVFYKKYTMAGAYVNMQVDLSLRGKGVYHVDLLDSKGNRLKTASVVVL